MKFLSFIIVLMSLVSTISAATTVKLATIIPIDSAWDKYLHEMGAEWEKITDGEVKLEIYSGGLQGSETEYLRKMRIGQLDAAILSPFAMNTIDPETFVFSVPFLFSDDQQVSYVLEKMNAQFNESFKRKGFVLMGMVQSGWINMFTTEKVVTGQDMAKKKLAISPSASKMGSSFSRSNVEIVYVATDEVLTAGQTGKVNAFALPSALGASFQVFTIAKYLNTVKIAPLIGGFIISKRTWDKIPAKYHVQLKQSVKRIEARFAAEYSKIELELLDFMTSLGGVTVTNPTQAEIDTWVKAFYHPADIVGKNKAITQATFDAANKAIGEYRLQKE